METPWDQLHTEIQACARCALAQGIRNKVPGQGNRKARLMLIGEGPGAEEDASGLAFVGKAGQLLTKMLAAIDLNREDVFIANVVKCRPPQNRAPLPVEMANCLPFLREQTRLIRPQVILVLGASALQVVLGPDKRITRCRGQWTESKGVFIMPTFHPAALLRDPAKKRDTWADLQAVRDKLAALSKSNA
ncbi:MAG: uracil-DNA glycosylase [Clostridiales bacterium]|nr:uracil-DNA glycosylase [Clostridiales bacterium]